MVLLTSLSGNAQIEQENFSSDKEKIKLENAHNYLDRKQYNSLMFDYSFQYTKLSDNDFLNTTNFTSYNFNYGNAYTFRALIYPVIVDAATFASYYNTNSSVNGYNLLRHRGGEFTASYVLPTYTFLPTRFYPYIGAGYQFSSIAYIDERIPSQSMLYKAGILFNWRQDLYLNLEYGRSSAFRNKYPYQHFTFSLGIRGETLYNTLLVVGSVLVYVFLESW